MGATAIESKPIHGSYGGDALPSTVIQAIEAMTLGNHSTPITSNTWKLWGPLQSNLICGSSANHCNPVQSIQCKSKPLPS